MGERLDVLRLGYRNGRDPRITTHLALVARAMGADGFLGHCDILIEEHQAFLPYTFGKGSGFQASVSKTASFSMKEPEVK